MRNFKRFLALVLAMLMLSSVVVVNASAATAGDYTDAAKRLSTIGILKGDGAGNLMLNSPVKRWQTALFFVQVLTGTTDAAALNATKTSSVFGDVTEYGTAIDQAYGFGIVRGRGDGSYGYNDNIIYQDMLVMAVRALGYETEAMQYPYGHYLAAMDLGLTENMAEDITMTKPLTRGETAQIIWNAITTEIAVTDPVTKKILYPGETGASSTLLGVDIDRETYLEKSKFAQDTLEGVIVDFVPGEVSTDADIAVVEIDGVEYEFDAAHLGIDEESLKASFLNLPVTMYINCKAEEFFELYDVDAELSEANVVFANMPRTSNVKNLGDEENIKYVEATDRAAEYYMLDGTKYSADDYAFDVRVLSDKGWVSDSYAVSDAFVWNKEDGFTGTNSYGEIDYYVTVDEDDNATLTMLYYPYSFGRYAERSLIYQPTATKMNVIAIGTYDPADTYKNLDNTSTHFKEYTLGKYPTLLSYGDSNLTKKQGEASVNVTVVGEEVASKDFVFYHYNEIDNILTIGANCGGTYTSKLTSFASVSETVKIGGKSYKLGFPGAFENNLPTFEDYDFEEDYLDLLTADLNNAHCIVYGDNVLFVSQVSNKTNIKHKYVILSTDSAIMADLLDMELSDYAAKVANTLGVYVDDKFNVKVATLDTKSGEWKLSDVDVVERGSYYVDKTNDDHPADSFQYSDDLSVHFEAYSLAGSNYKKTSDLKKAVQVLTTNPILMLRGETSKGYTLSVIKDSYIEYGENNSGIHFSDVKAVTNKIKDVKDSGVASSRKTLNANSVIVIIDENNVVGVRKGIQKEENSFSAKGRFYTATNDLIVFRVTENTGGVSASEWADKVPSGNSYYVVTAESEISVEKNDDGTITFTLENLFDIKNLAKVATTTVTVDSVNDTNVDTDFEVGAVIVKDETGTNVSDLGLDEAFLEAVNAFLEDDDTFYLADMDTLDFADHESITIDLIGGDSLDKRDAVNYIDIMLATINLSEVDTDKYDITDMAFVTDDTDADYLDGITTVRLTADNTTDKAFEYALTGMGQTLAVSAPSAGKFDNYIINTAGEELLVPEVDGKYYDGATTATVNVYVCGSFSEKDGTLTLYVLKTLCDAD